MLNRENMIKWAEALESGEYKQKRHGWGQFTRENGCVEHEGEFCCLNVCLKALTGADVGLSKSLGVRDVKELTGVESVSPFITWNDDAGLTFPQIAAKIREMVAEEEQAVGA